MAVSSWSKLWQAFWFISEVGMRSLDVRLLRNTDEVAEKFGVNCKKL